ncbi:MAG: nucleotide exchange factor GrpE [bacterium]
MEKSQEERFWGGPGKNAGKGPEPCQPSSFFEGEANASPSENEIMVQEEESAAQKQIEEMDQAVADLQRQLQEMEDRWKRAAADLDNYRKRFERELERLRFSERDMVLREWLAVVDNMERALKAENASQSPWYQGMQAIYQQMMGVLGLFRVTPFNPKGEPFDPVCHDAVATVDLKDEPEGIIAEVAEPGYKISDRILRPAKVIPVRHQKAR